jgi:hypothetical protein
MKEIINYKIYLKFFLCLITPQSIHFFFTCINNVVEQVCYVLCKCVKLYWKGN